MLYNPFTENYREITKCYPVEATFVITINLWVSEPLLKLICANIFIVLWRMTIARSHAIERSLEFIATKYGFLGRFRHLLILRSTTMRFSDVSSISVMPSYFMSHWGCFVCLCNDLSTKFNLINKGYLVVLLHEAEMTILYICLAIILTTFESSCLPFSNIPSSSIKRFPESKSTSLVALAFQLHEM